MKKQNKIFIFVLAFILVLTIGYALFSESLEIRGTANATGNFDVEFYSIGNITEIGSEGASATISDDKNSLVINVPNLKYQTANVTIPVTVKNFGSIAAKLDLITESGIDKNENIKVTYSGIGASDVPLLQDQTNTFNINIEWLNGEAKENISTSFSIELNYIQAN